MVGIQTILRSKNDTNQLWNNNFKRWMFKDDMWLFEFLSSFQNHEQKQAINELLSC
jgi:hypothetical protein